MCEFSTKVKFASECTRETIVTSLRISTRLLERVRVMNSRGAEEYERFVRPIAIVCRLIGVWPLDHDHGKLKSRLRIFHKIVMIALSFTLTCAVSVDVSKHRNEMSEATECALIASAFALCFVRMVTYTIHSEDIDYVVDSMRRDWIESTIEDRIVFNEKCRFTFKLAKQFIVTVFLALSLFAIAPIVDIVIFHSEERMLPFRGYFINNQTQSPIYECVYAFGAFSGMLCGATIAGVTSFNLVVTMHGAARFAVIQRRLEALKSEDPQGEAAIADCVKRHQDAIKFADALERIINVLALGQFIISTGLVCCAGFQITAMLKDKSRLMKYCSFLNSAILELFLFSYSGNRLIDESEAVGDSAYAVDWIGSNYPQDLQIIMLRATRPSKITAAKFYEMSLRSFSSVLSTSFSYFTVLQTVNEE